MISLNAHVTGKNVTRTADRLLKRKLASKSIFTTSLGLLVSVAPVIHSKREIRGSQSAIVGTNCLTVVEGIGSPA